MKDRNPNKKIEITDKTKKKVNMVDKGKLRHGDQSEGKTVFEHSSSVVVGQK